MNKATTTQAHFFDRTIRYAGVAAIVGFVVAFALAPVGASVPFLGIGIFCTILTSYCAFSRMKDRRGR